MISQDLIRSEECE
jgi:hypothetical protein